LALAFLSSKPREPPQKTLFNIQTSLPKTRLNHPTLWSHQSRGAFAIIQKPFPNTLRKFDASKTKVQKRTPHWEAWHMLNMPRRDSKTVRLFSA